MVKKAQKKLDIEIIAILFFLL